MNKMGLDYGTSTTLLSITQGIGDRGIVTSLIDIGGDRSGYMRSSIPSLVAIGRSGQMKFGYDAEELLVNAREGGFVILKSLKRCLNCDRLTRPEGGQCLNPPVSQYCKGDQEFNIHGVGYKVKELIKRFIDNVMNYPHVRAELINKEFAGLGITVPALFSRDPRKTIYEIILTNLQSPSIDVINEPTAALIAGEEDLMIEEDGIIAVCDIGGGTTDIVLVDKQEKGRNLYIFDPGGISVAGDDVDRALYDYLDLNGLIEHVQDMATTNYQIKRAKELLTTIGRATVFGHVLTKVEFERAVTPVVSKIVDALKQEIMKVYEHYRNTDQEFKLIKIYLSGGGSKLLLVKEMILRDRLISSFNPKVGYISNAAAEQLFQDDTPIVMVAMGASMPRKGFRDSIQSMLPYDIEVRVDNKAKVQIGSYKKLPVEFIVSAEAEGQIKLLALDPSTQEVRYDLGEEIFAIGGQCNLLLQEFIDRSRRIKVLISQYNIMRVELTSLHGCPTRRFNLPWQGGIESDIFEKFRKEWRRTHGFA